MKLHASIIVTYRCNARCNMCETWKCPTTPSEEIGLDIIEKLPSLFFANITGGEPFIRQDIHEIVNILRRKSKRIVISTNGYFTDRIVSLCKQFPDIGIRISVEGLSGNNNKIRNIPDGFDRSMKTLLTLREMGCKDIGFAMTIQDHNYGDLLHLLHLAKALGYEFATAAVHNSHYFHKMDNQINAKNEIANEIEKMIREFLKSKKIKDWFRAYFNFGLMNFVFGQKRLLKCEMAQNGFFVDPSGDVLACNGMDTKMPMGNLKNQSWEEIWNSQQAEKVRDAVHICNKNCWMIGNAAPAMWQNLNIPVKWIIRNKLNMILGKPIN